MMNSANLRLIAFGLCAGFLLSVMRAPLGLDWTQLPATSGNTQALFRAAALIATALFLSAARPAFRGRFSGAWLLFAILIGFAIHGLWLAAHFQPSGRAQYGLVLIAGTVLLRLIAGSKHTATEGAPGLSQIMALSSSVRFPERSGLFLAGAGVAVAFEGLAHEVRLFGLGLPEDDAFHAVVFITLSLLGALAFGPFLRRKQIERPAFAYGLPIIAASALAGLWFLAERDREGLFRYLRRMDLFVDYGRKIDGFLPANLHLEDIPSLDGTSIGTWWITGILAAAAWVVPAFWFGATIGGTRHPGRVSNALLGAAAGLLFRPWLIAALADPLGFGQLPSTPWAWKMIVAGTVLAASGAALAIAMSETGRAKKFAPVLLLSAIGLPWIRPNLSLWTFSPWYITDIEPRVTLPSSAGLLTVEATRGGVQIVTVDRRRVTPGFMDYRNDWRRLQYSHSLIDPKALGDRRPEVLFVGQLTPERSRFFSEAKVELERTAAWYRSFETLEKELFAGHPDPLGEVLSPVEARARIEAGRYDLVIAAPTHGPVLLPKGASWLPWASVEEPLLQALELPEGTVGVVWIDAASPLTRRQLGDGVMLAMERFDDLSVGVVFGVKPGERPDGAPMFAPGTPSGRIGILPLLDTLPRARLFQLQTAVMESLAEANENNPRGGIVRGLAQHYGAQEESSPYEKRAQQIELNEDALRSYMQALPEKGDLDQFSRELWEAVAWLLTEKRRPDLGLAFLEPLADAYTPWPRLDRAVAYAHRELLDPKTALKFLRRAERSIKLDINLYLEFAATARELGDDDLAVICLRKGLAIQPDRIDLELPLALALMRLDKPEGREILERLARQYPDHEEIPHYLVEGPPKGGPQPFSPSGGQHEH